MATTTVPTYTAAAAGNVIASASIAASGTSSSTTALDFSANFEGQIHVLNTPSGSVAATRGLQVQVFRRYGTTPTTGQTAFLTYTLPSAVASTAESLDFFLPTGKYAITLTNLDGTNAVTASVTSDVITNLATA